MKNVSLSKYLITVGPGIWTEEQSRLVGNIETIVTQVKVKRN